MSSPIFVAIDTPDLERAKGLAKAIKRHAGGIKLGLEFFAANGPAGVAEIAHLGLPIFLDLKLHDIPNTVAKAVQALRYLEPAVLTVHGAGGQAMLEEAKAAAPAATRVVAVTVLTSLDEDDLAATGVNGSPHEVRAIGRYGISNPRVFDVCELPQAVEVEPNNGQSTATELKWPAVMNGRSNQQKRAREGR